jgi:transcriptional regulator with XRE-family HTH domain
MRNGIDKIGVSERIFFNRKKQKMSQATLGQLYGVSKSAVSEWEKGLYLPKRLDQVALILKVTENHLLYGGENELVDHVRAKAISQKFIEADENTKQIIERIFEIRTY